MKVYGCPKEIPEPVIDYKNFDLAKMQAAEDAHAAALKAHLIGKGYTGKHTGEILAVPYADGHACYMFADGGRKSVLIHLPYGDAWNNPDVQFLPKTEVLRRIQARKGLAALFAKAASDGVPSSMVKKMNRHED